MKKKKTPLIFTLALLLISCNQTRPDNVSIEPTVNNSVEKSSTLIEPTSDLLISEGETIEDNDEVFGEYKEELCVLLANYYTSASINLFSESNDFIGNQMFSNATINIKESSTFNEALSNYKLAIQEINEYFPYANGVINFTNSNDKVNIYKAIEDYLIRNNLTRLNIFENDGFFSLNINATSKETWEYLFGENGKILKTNKEDYWDVKPVLSNHFFIKALDLAINKEEIANENDAYPKTSLWIQSNS